MSDQWKVLGSEEIYKTKLFSLRVDECELPDGRTMPRYYVFDFPDWVQVVPVTEDKQVLMLRQYRHAGKKRYLEVPGGATDSREEDPLKAARRELKEETGYETSDWHNLGSHSPNPALQSNQLHTFLALGCRKVSDLDLDPFEDLEVHTMSVEQVLKALESGHIEHSLIMASLALARPHLERL